ncbi:OmpA family protein [Microscilla marina]|nr:OmpA family protein [Microscilla marina]
MKQYLQTWYLITTLALLGGMQLQAQDKNYQVSNIGDPINTKRYVEYAPTLSTNGKTLIFQSNNNEERHWKLYESTLNDEGKWSPPQALSSINNYQGGAHYVAGPSLSKNADTLYFCASYTTDNRDIYYSIKNGNTWGEPISIGSPVNSDQYEGFPSIAADGMSLYFMRRDTTGEVKNYKAKRKNPLKNKDPYHIKVGEDGKITKYKGICYVLYVSHKGTNGTWQTPEALPNVINNGCEKCPRIMPDNATLIFSSIRKGGKGNFDLYVSTLDLTGKWTMPKALDFINTSKKDQLATIPLSSNVMYFNTKGRRNADIFKVSPLPDYLQLQKFTRVEGRVIDSLTKKPVEAKVSILVKDSANKNTPIQAVSSFKEKDGKFAAKLRRGYKYALEIKAKNYLPLIREVDLSDNTVDDSLKKLDNHIALPPAHLSHSIRLTILNKETNEPVEAHVKVINTSKNRIVTLNTVAVEGKYSTAVESQSEYTVEITALGYDFFQGKVDTRKLSRGQDYIATISLKSNANKLLLTIVDKETGKNLSSLVKYTNLNNNRTTTKATKEGKLTVFLNRDSKYTFEANAKGYFFQSFEVKTDTLKPGDVIKLTVALEVLKMNAKIVLNHINFASGSSKLDEDSYVELAKVVQLMENNKDIKLEISAHTDNVGVYSRNMRLSRQRAQSVFNYLIKTGVDKKRLVSKGYGSARPLVPNTTKKNKAKNRRVEFKVIGTSTKK